MLDLSILMAERVGFVIILAFLLVNIPYFRKRLFHRSFSSAVQLILIFSLFAILTDLTGIELDPNNVIQNQSLLTHVPSTYSVVNARILSVTVAGIIGGPWVGSTVGLIAGSFRVLQGGLAQQAWFYVPSSVLIGIASGLLYKNRRTSFATMTASKAFFVGLSMELVQMVFILLFSPTGWKLVRVIAIPMTIISSIGTSIFISIITMYLRQEQETKATQTQSVLQLASETLPYFRNGLTMSSAQQIVKIIKEHTNFDAISITNREIILAHIGAASDHHIAGKTLATQLSQSVITSGKVQVARTAKAIGCAHPDCPLEAAVVVPLSAHHEIIGTLKMYYVDSWRLTPVEIQLAMGLGEIFAGQIRLGEAEKQATLLRNAEIKSLQAQVNPHFFFNAINTISALSRFNVEQARQLLLQLATYFRANLLGARATQITLDAEIKQVQAYLELEQARFPHRYQVNFAIAVDRNVLVPPFSIQVLVENAIKHGFEGRKSGNVVTVIVTREQDRLAIRVQDNGRGIAPAIQEKLGREVINSSRGNGTAFYNLNQRLVGLYDQHSRLQVQSGNAGTVVATSIPFQTKEQNNESIDR